MYGGGAGWVSPSNGLVGLSPSKRLSERTGYKVLSSGSLLLNSLMRESKGTPTMSRLR